MKSKYTMLCEFHYTFIYNVRGIVAFVCLSHFGEQVVGLKVKYTVELELVIVADFYENLVPLFVFRITNVVPLFV